MGSKSPTSIPPGKAHDIIIVLTVEGSVKEKYRTVMANALVQLLVFYRLPRSRFVKDLVSEGTAGDF